MSNTNNILCTLSYIVPVHFIRGLREREREIEIIFMMKFSARFSETLHTGSPHPVLYCSPASTLQPKATIKTDKAVRLDFSFLFSGSTFRIGVK